MNQKIIIALVVVVVVIVIVAVGVVKYTKSSVTKPIDIEKIKSAIRMEPDNQKRLTMVTNEINRLNLEKVGSDAARQVELDVAIAELTRVQSVIAQAMVVVVVPPPVVVSPPVQPPVVVSPPVIPPTPSPNTRGATISAMEAHITDFFKQTGRVMSETASYKNSTDPTIRGSATAALSFAQSADTEVRRNARVFVIAAFDANQAANFLVADNEIAKAKASLEQGSSMLLNAQLELRNMNINVLKTDMPILQRANNQIYSETAPYVTVTSMITRSLVALTRADADASNLEIMRANAFIEAALSYMSSGNTSAADNNIDSAKAKYQSALTLTKRAQGQIPSIKM